MKNTTNPKLTALRIQARTALRLAQKAQMAELNAKAAKNEKGSSK